MERFFVNPEDIHENTAVITGEDVAHITRVLRLGPGDTIAVCDGQGWEFTAKIESATPQQVTVTLTDASLNESEPQQRVTLFQGLPKAGKLEIIVQKCVELGVHAVQPVLARRCVAKPSDIDHRINRFNRVAYEAAKQSQRGYIPAVLPLKKLEACDFTGFDLVLLAYEEERVQSLKSVLQQNTGAMNIAIIIGPEGGIAAEEAAWLQKGNARTVSLGRRILRTETAGMAVLAMLFYELEQQA